MPVSQGCKGEGDVFSFPLPADTKLRPQEESGLLCVQPTCNIFYTICFEFVGKYMNTLNYLLSTPKQTDFRNQIASQLPYDTIGSIFSVKTIMLATAQVLSTNSSNTTETQPFDKPIVVFHETNEINVRYWFWTFSRIVRVRTLLLQISTQFFFSSV